MPESRLTYDQFKADILRWKNSHREEYNRFARLMTNGDERQYLAICRAIFKQLPKVKKGSFERSKPPSLPADLAKRNRLQVRNGPG